MLIVSEASGVHRMWGQFLHPTNGNLTFQQLAVIDPCEWLARPVLNNTQQPHHYQPLAYLHFPAVVGHLRRMMFDRSVATEVQQALREKFRPLLDMNTYHRDLLLMARSDGGLIVFGMEVCWG